MNKRALLYGFLILLIMVILAIYMPSGILTEPHITPLDYLNTKPYMMIGDVVIIVPSSTIIVYLLGIYILYIGYSLYKNKQSLWGISLFFWGIGTILAGTSYQGLGYELKCATEEFCLFTSWFELSYLFMTSISISLMAFAFTNTFSPRNKGLVLY